MPHESTVDRESEEESDPEVLSNIAPRWRDSEGKESKRPRLAQVDSLVPHLRAETPKKITHHHDEDDSDDEGSSSSSSACDKSAGNV